jgi:hypothetical protein
MNKFLLTLVLCAVPVGVGGLTPVSALAAPSAQIAMAKKPQPMAQKAKVTARQKKFELADGTIVRLKFKQALSSKHARTDASINFEVAEDVQVGNKIVIARGAKARGTILEAKKAGMLGRKGKLEIGLRDVELVTGDRVDLRSIQEEGGGNDGGVIAAAAIVNPLFLLIKGKNVNYDAGTEFTAYITGDYELNPVDF